MGAVIDSADDPRPYLNHATCIQWQTMKMTMIAPMAMAKCLLTHTLCASRAAFDWSMMGPQTEFGSEKEIVVGEDSELVKEDIAEKRSEGKKTEFSNSMEK